MKVLEAWERNFKTGNSTAIILSFKTIQIDELYFKLNPFCLISKLNKLYISDINIVCQVSHCQIQKHCSNMSGQHIITWWSFKGKI